MLIGLANQTADQTAEAIDTARIAEAARILCDRSDWRQERAAAPLGGSASFPGKD